MTDIVPTAATGFTPPPSRSRARRRDCAPQVLRWHWRLLFVSFVVGGIYEVVDNLLGLRQLNFESSAPAGFKVAKELAICWLLLGMARRWRMPRLSRFGLGVTCAVLLAFLPQFFAPPTTSYGAAGLLYFGASTAALLTTCALFRPGISQDFARNFLLPVLLVTLITQLLEAWLAPSSFYYETNLLGLDRRAGIAAIPTTAGLLGVVGYACLRGAGRWIALLVIAMANSTLSLLCLFVVLATKVRRPAWLVLVLPMIATVGTVAVVSRGGLELSIATRLDILTDTLTQLAWFGPSSVGPLATAKSVALAPFDSAIVDSFYLEVLHVFGVVPGLLFVGAIFATLYRRAGVLALSLFAITALGFLELEAWIVWLSLLFGLPRAAHPLRIRRREVSAPSDTSAGQETDT